MVADVRVLELPLHDADRPFAVHPPSLPRLPAVVRAAGVLLRCTPTYPGTVADGPKNVLEALDPLGDDYPPSFTGKLVGRITVGVGGAANSITFPQLVARALNGLLVPTTVMVPGRAVDPAIGVQINEPALSDPCGWSTRCSTLPRVSGDPRACNRPSATAPARNNDAHSVRALLIPAAEFGG